MSKDSREAAKSALARLCEWRGLNCYLQNPLKIACGDGIFALLLHFLTVSAYIDTCRGIF